MDEIVIDSLGEYINEIEKFPSSKFFFRGEPEENEERTASALRYYKGASEEQKEYPFKKMIDDFYREVTPVVSTVEHENFIAFAQHHGIPTALIDITKSPLVALYFACQDQTEENGYVYIFGENYIDITKVVQKYPKQNILEELFFNNEKDFLILIPLLERYYMDYRDDFNRNLSNLFKDSKHYFGNTFDDTERQILGEISKEKPDLWIIMHGLQELDGSVSLDLRKSCSIEVFVYLNLVRWFLRKAHSHGEPICWLDFLPNMVYRPIMKFNRGLNQSGLFLYQAHVSYLDKTYDSRVQMVQRINCNELVFHIKNKKQILESLDNIGINQMTLFSDFDSTASYIRSKYENLYGLK